MRTLDEIRKYFLDVLNHALRRLSMYGGEISARHLLSHIAFVEDREAELGAQYDAMGASGMDSASGAFGVFAERTRDHHSDEAIGSVYAEMAFQMGYLTTHRILTRAEFDSLKAAVRKACRTRDFTTQEVHDEFGPPSWSTGGSSCYQCCYLYITDQPSYDAVAFDFWNEFDKDNKTGEYRGKYGDLPVLMNVRIRGEHRGYDWEFTPKGRNIVGPSAKK